MPDRAACRLNPYTSAIAHTAGWRWEIPLQHRIGNGFVYSSNHMGDDEARAMFLSQLKAPPITEPFHIKFRTGRRKKIWNKNVIAFGLSSGFIEPLESTNIHLMQVCAMRLMQMFPFSGIHESQVANFNRVTAAEVEKIRNFVIMHYKATERDDTPYWRDRSDMTIPDDLAARIQLFRDTGEAYKYEDEIFPPGFVDTGPAGTACPPAGLSSHSGPGDRGGPARHARWPARQDCREPRPASRPMRPISASTVAHPGPASREKPLPVGLTVAPSSTRHRKPVCMRMKHKGLTRRN